LTDDERASRLPPAEKEEFAKFKADASDVELVPSRNPRFEAAPIPFGGGAATPVPPVVASPFATLPSSSISSSPKPALMQVKINSIYRQIPIMKHKSDSIFTLGHSSDEEDYAVDDSQD
jgi:hypothetical protein